MGINWNGVNSGCKSKSDQQIVGKGTNNTAHENIRSFLTCGAHPESNHLCPSSKGHDGCSDNSLAQSNTLGETKSTLHQSRPPTATRKTSPAATRTAPLSGNRRRRCNSRDGSFEGGIGPLSSAAGAPSPFPARPRDRPPRPAGTRRARRRAAVRARGHGDRRPPRPAADRGTRPGRDRARRRVHGFQLPHVWDDGRRGAQVRRRAGAASHASRGAGVVGFARDWDRAARRVRDRRGAAPRGAGRPRSLRPLRARVLPDRRGRPAGGARRSRGPGLPAWRLEPAPAARDRRRRERREPRARGALRLRLRLGDRRLGSGNGRRPGRDGRRIRRRAAPAVRTLPPSELA